MSTFDIPKGHQAVMPYLIVEGAAEFREFMEKVFGAEETFRKNDERGGIIHAELNVNGATIMFADSTPDWQPCPAGMYIYCEDVDKTYQKALDQGATSIMEPKEQDYGRAAGVKDPFGNLWWITKP